MTFGDQVEVWLDAGGRWAVTRHRHITHIVMAHMSANVAAGKKLVMDITSTLDKGRIACVLIYVSLCGMFKLHGNGKKCFTTLALLEVQQRSRHGLPSFPIVLFAFEDANVCC